MKNFDTIFYETISKTKKIQDVDTIPYSGSSLIVISKDLDQTQFRLIEEAVLKKQPVTLITSTDLANSKKNELLMLLTDMDENHDNPDYTLLRVFKWVGWGLIVLGIVVFVALFLSDALKLKIKFSNDIFNIFLPLLLAYIGFMLVDLMDKQMAKKIKTRSNMEIHILKKKEFKQKEKITVLDEKRAYVSRKFDHEMFELDEFSTNQIAKMIIEARKMDKKQKIEVNKTALWLFDS